MKRAIISLVLVSIIAIAGITQDEKVAIVDFKVVGMDDAYQDVLWEQLSISFQDNGKYEVIEHGDVEKARGSLKETLTQDQAVEIGKKVNADVAVLAKVAKFDGSYMLNVRGLNVATGKTEFARKQTANSFTQVAHIMNYLASPQAQPQLSHAAHKYKQNQNKHNHNHNNHHGKQSHGNTKHPNYNRRNHYNHNKNLKPVSLGSIEAYPVDIGWATWEEAIEKCQNFDAGGYDDWRLPNKDEMEILIENKNRLGVNQHNYWTIEADDDRYAYQANPYTGIQVSDRKDNYHAVRCIRTSR